MEGETAVYEGEEKLVFCADVGTTQSAVTLIHCVPGSVPRVKLVSRWPGARDSCKIPSVILYDSSGAPSAFGASALEESVQATADEEGWFTCKHWKLLLHHGIEMSAPPPYSPHPTPAASSRYVQCLAKGMESLQVDRESRGLGGERSSFELSPLPPGVGVEKVYEDWFRYLFVAAKKWLVDSDIDGDYIWNKLEQTMVFLLSHPNGWGLVEQSILSNALAKAVPSVNLGPGNLTDRVEFVSEAEAAVHFALKHASATSLDRWLACGSEFLVIDAGGSTVDITSYVVKETTPTLRLSELKPSACVQAGAIFPTRDAMETIKAKLSSSRYGDAETLAEIRILFDTNTKCRFDDPTSDQLIKIGKDSCNDPANGIKRGRLTLKGSEVAAAFETSVNRILESVSDQLKGTNIKGMILSGGFGESPYLKRRLREIYQPQGITIVTSDEPSKKAVAEGAAYHYIRESVVARAARYTFGCLAQCPISNFPTHLRNVGEYKSFKDVDGVEKQNGMFTVVLRKGEIIKSDHIASQSFVQIVSCKNPKNIIDNDSVFIRTSDDDRSYSIMIDSRGQIAPEYERVCDIRTDYTPMCTDANRLKGSKGDYWRIPLKVGICFGGTSLKAWVFWIENGVEKKGPASVIPRGYL